MRVFIKDLPQQEEQEPMRLKRHQVCSYQAAQMPSWGGQRKWSVVGQT